MDTDASDQKKRALSSETQLLDAREKVSETENSDVSFQISRLAETQAEGFNRLSGLLGRVLDCLEKLDTTSTVGQSTDHGIQRSQSQRRPKSLEIPRQGSTDLLTSPSNAQWVVRRNTLLPGHLFSGRGSGEDKDRDRFLQRQRSSMRPMVGRRPPPDVNAPKADDVPLLLLPPLDKSRSVASIDVPGDVDLALQAYPRVPEVDNEMVGCAPSQDEPGSCPVQDDQMSSDDDSTDEKDDQERLEGDQWLRQRSLWFLSFVRESKSGVGAFNKANKEKHKGLYIKQKEEIMAATRQSALLRLFIRTYFWTIIHPSSNLRTKWDTLILFLVGYICLAQPYYICFGVNTRLTDNLALGVIESIVDICFVFDIYMNLRTGYIDQDGGLILSRWRIFKSYAKGWMIIDVVSVVPWDLILASSQVGLLQIVKATRAVKSMKMLRMLKMMKMLKLLKVPNAIQSLENRMGRTAIRGITFMLAAITTVHIIGCLFHYLAYLEDFGDNTWVAMSNMQDSRNFNRYVAALYWSMSTMTTVGFGDIAPASMQEQLLVMVGMMVGVTVYAYFMGSMGAMLSAWNNTSSNKAAKRQLIDEFLRYRKLPRNLSKRVRDFYHYVTDREVQKDETDIIHGLPRSLKEEVLVFLYRDTLEKVAFFRGKHPQFISMVVLHLKMEFYAPGEYVVRRGDIGNEMYFIVEGKLEERECGEDWGERDWMHDKEKKRDSKTSAKLRPSLYWHRRDDQDKAKAILRVGQFFGEHGCMTGGVRETSVMALEFCELYSLSREDLNSCLRHWPELAQEFSCHVRAKKAKRRTTEPITTTVYPTTELNPLGFPAGTTSEDYFTLGSSLPMSNEANTRHA